MLKVCGARAQGLGFGVSGLWLKVRGDHEDETEEHEKMTT